MMVMVTCAFVGVQNMLKSAAHTLKQTNLAKLHEQSKYNLEHEIQNYKDEAQKQRKIIYQLEKERDRYINEASDLTQKVRNDHYLDHVHRDLTQKVRNDHYLDHVH